MSKRDRNKQDKMMRIAQAARELFHDQGFAATTTHQVAARAGVANGTIFLYVNTKEDLLTLAFGREMKDVVLASFSAIDDQMSFVDQVHDFFAALLHYHGADLVIARELLREVGFLRDPSRDYGIHEIPFLPSLHALVERGVVSGELDRACPRELIVHSLFAYYWWCLRELVHERCTVPQGLELLRSMTRLLVSGIGKAI